MANKNKEKIIEKTGSVASTVSGTMGFLGGYQVCHNVCLGIVALLSFIGITVVGMPLLFLTKVAVPFWIAAAVLLGITLFFYFKKKCISKNLIIFNFGVIIAGIPFQQLQKFSILFWITGSTLVLISILLFIKSKAITKKIRDL